MSLMTLPEQFGVVVNVEGRETLPAACCGEGLHLRDGAFLAGAGSAPVFVIFDIRRCGLPLVPRAAFPRQLGIAIGIGRG